MAVAHTTTCQNYCSLHRKKCKETGVFKMKGTFFQKKVWNYLKTIPKGQVRTYKQVAIGIKRPKSARAVANACAKNPSLEIIPCHRVIRSDGKMGGYMGEKGIERKKKLLEREGIKF